MGRRGDTRTWTLYIEAYNNKPIHKNQLGRMRLNQGKANDGRATILYRSPESTSPNMFIYSRATFDQRKHSHPSFALIAFNASRFSLGGSVQTTRSPILAILSIRTRIPQRLACTFRK